MKKGRADLTGALLLIALFLFVLDIATRRMRWDARLLSWILARKAKVRAKPAPVVGPALMHQPNGIPAGEVYSASDAKPAMAPAPKEKKPAVAPQDAPANSSAQALLERRKQQKRY